MQDNQRRNAATKITILCLGFVLLLLSFQVAAEPILPLEKSGPIEVSSDRLEADDKAQTLVFSGHAVATQNDVSIQADRLTVKYIGEDRQIEQVVADGSVRIVQGSRVATGEKATLFHNEQRIVLTGSPRVADGENFVQGEEITIFLNDQRSIVTGGAGGRVNATFSPKTEKQP
jgi:lipopolysaccharide export system protein LptA